MPKKLQVKLPIKIWWLMIPILTTLNQALMKALALQLGPEQISLAWVLKALHSPLLLGIVICEIAAFILWMRILANVPVSKAVPLSASAYILILLTSWFIFHEKIFLLQVIGGTFILGGVWLIGTASKTKRLI